MRALLITRLPRARAVGKRNAAAAVGRGQAARARRKSELLNADYVFKFFASWCTDLATRNWCFTLPLPLVCCSTPRFARQRCRERREGTGQSGRGLRHGVPIDASSGATAVSPLVISGETATTFATTCRESSRFACTTHHSRA